MSTATLMFTIGTELSNCRAPRSAREGAEVIYRAATLPPGSPGGTFMGEDGPLPW